MNGRRISKLVHEGTYVAEVDVGNDDTKAKHPAHHRADPIHG